MALREQNNPNVTGQSPSYYANNRLYPGAYARTDWPTRTSRRVHDGFSLTANYGLDTTSDDINESPYSSPYYINGRYFSENLVTQRGNSASVQGTEKLLTVHDEVEDFTTSDVQTTIKMWQGKQIKFEIPYNGKIVGNTITIQNTKECTGILSIYFSTTDGGVPIYETAVDLCKVSTDKPEHLELRSMTVFPAKANPRGKLYVRMEIWDEIDMERSANPFNTGRYIEIASTGAGNHDACEYTLGNKNMPVKETYDYKRFPSRPLIGLIYNDYVSVPVDRLGDEKTGATVSKGGYRYDIFCIKDGTHAEMLIYDKAMNKIVEGTSIKVDGRAEEVYIAQVVQPGATEENFVYYVDGFSPLQRFKIDEWDSEEVISPDASLPIVKGAGLILYHNNRLYLGKFRNDPNLWQCSAILANGPDFTQFPYRFYTPNASPYLTSTNTVTAIVEYASDQLMILGKNFYSIFQTNNFELDTSVSQDTKSYPTQISSWTDSVGVQSQGDVVNYKGVVYSFDPKEGIRRFSGAVWNRLPNSIDSHFDRVDMDKPRKMWGFANKLYFNYTDKIDGHAKCLIWDMTMNYQQYPWFQDVDVPFCDARFDETEDLVGIHPDYPCIMRLYAADVWRRLDTPIRFERHTKFLSVPGNASDMIVKRIHDKVIANCNRWWYFGISTDKQLLEQHRGKDVWYRIPCWDTITDAEPSEYPFPIQDVYEEDAIIRLTISNLRIKCASIQVKIMARTFRGQANLVSTLIEVGIRQYN